MLILAADLPVAYKEESAEDVTTNEELKALLQRATHEHYLKGSDASAQLANASSESVLTSVNTSSYALIWPPLQATS